MNTRKLLATSTAMALGLAFLAVPAVAQDQANGETLQHLGQVILGYKADGTPVYAGENSTALDESDLLQTGGAAALDSLLRQQTSVFTQQDIGNPGVAVNIRGFEGSGRVAMSIDGVPQNFRINGHAAQGNTFVDPNLLSSIDITRGAVTTVGGTGIAGSVDFRTISAEDVVRSGQGWGGLSRLSYGDNGNSKSGMIATAYMDQRFNALLALSKSTADDYEDGNGNVVANSWEDVDSGLVKVGVNIGEGQSLSFSAMRYEADFFATSYNQELSNTTYTLGYKYDAGDGLVNLSVNAYTNKLETEWVCCSISSGRVMSTRTNGLNVTNVSEFTLGAWDVVSVNGLDYSTDKLGGKTGGTNPTSGTADRFAVFSENIFTLDRWEITAGLRANRYDLDGVMTSGSMDVDHRSLDPKLTVAYRVNDWLQPYATVSKATRAPTLQETMMGGTHPGGGVAGMIANPLLKPEESTGFELGFNLSKQGLFTGNDSLTGRVNYYKMDVENYVVASYPGVFTNAFGVTGIAFINLPGTSKTQGLEVELQYDIANYGFGLSYTRNDSDMPSQVPGLGAGQYLPDSTVSLNAEGRYLEDKLTLGLQYNYVSGGLYTSTYQNVPTNRDDSYETFNLYAVYDVNDNFSLNARVENLFDKTYVPWLSLSENDPGRSVFIGGELRF